MNIREGREELGEEIQQRFSKKTERLSEMALINKVALLSFAAVNAVLLLLYLVELIQGKRTLAYYGIFAFLALCPVVTGFICYRRNVETTAIMHLISYGYGIFYTYIIFTSSSATSYVYVVPLLLIVTLYSDTRYSVLVSCAAFIDNIIHMIYLAVQKGILKEEIPEYVNRVLLIFLVGFFTIMVSRVIKYVNERKMESVQTEKENVTRLLDKVMTTGNEMAENVGQVTTKMERLTESIIHTKDAMEEVSAGTSKTAVSIQNQMLKTEEIQRHIRKVAEASEVISSDMEQAKEAVESGSRTVELMIQNVEESGTVSKEVSKELEKLHEHTAQMESIVGIITGITSQTSLLALNASIEAARAGEAGRGFAVVASEISNLAKQTQDATVHITDLIQNVGKELEKVVQVIQNLLDSSESQERIAAETAGSFELITNKTLSVTTRAMDLSDSVKELADANAVIVESIQTISAITEEVTAHSNETYIGSEENSQTAEQITELIQKLDGLAVKLKQEET